MHTKAIDCHQVKFKRTLLLILLNWLWPLTNNHICQARSFRICESTLIMEQYTKKVRYWIRPIIAQILKMTFFSMYIYRIYCDRRLLTSIMRGCVGALNWIACIPKCIQANNHSKNWKSFISIETPEEKKQICHSNIGLMYAIQSSKIRMQLWQFPIIFHILSICSIEWAIY